MRITNRFELGPFFTFEPSKEKPIYNWFFYKEAFSPEFVEKTLDDFGITAGNVLDPFSGIGTTALAAKSRRLQAHGLDASPLAVFAGMVKTRNYTQADVDAVEGFMKNVFQEKTQPRIRWDFELFRIEKAFPPANLRDMLSVREKIAQVENQNAHNLLLLALVSIIPMCSFVLKDGGVLRIAKKSVAPVREMFKRRVKRMVSDIAEHQVVGPEPEIYLADARDMPFDSETMDAVITSPPYLNNIDYTKVYGLELSLLEMDPESARVARARSLRSFITSSASVPEIPPELGEIGHRIPVAGTYFSDMEKVLYETFRVLRPKCSASFVVGNAVIHETHIAVDEILAEMGERIGFESEIRVGLERIADVRPAKVKTRESAVIFKKP